MKIKEVTVSRYRGWVGPTTWFPGDHDVLLGPNNGGKTSLLRAVDLVLNPHRNPHRDLLGVHDYFDLKTAEPIEITVVLSDLSDDDCDVFEPFLEGQRADLTFGPADSPDEELTRDHSSSGSSSSPSWTLPQTLCSRVPTLAGPG